MSTPFGQKSKAKRPTVRWECWVDDLLADIAAIGDAVGLHDPIEAFSVGGGDPLFGSPSRATADYECRHGRLSGDRCPQPTTVPDGPESRRPNPDRRWTEPYPCECWGEVVVKSVTTPDPFALAGNTRATLSHEALTDPVRLPSFDTKGCENGKKQPAGPRRGDRSEDARLVTTL
jgi:hypothetical protein